MEKKIRPDGYFTIFLVLAIISHLISPITKLIFSPFNLIGIIIIIIGVVMTTGTNSLILKNRTAIKPDEIPSFLITSELFKFSRNPLYLGMAIILIGVCIFLGSSSPFIFAIIFILLIDRLFIPLEEHNLEKKFNNRYLDYQKKVRRWI